MPDPVFTPAVAAAALYAGLNGLLLLWLSMTVVRGRVRAKVLLGDGGDAGLSRAIRAHANFAEHAPLALLMMALAAMAGAPALAVHVVGLMLTVGRLLHAVHLIRSEGPGALRLVGMLLTYLAILLSAVGLIGHAVAAL
jgi:uncharacterized membrane protein YecN with MAPEG domain